MLDCFANTIVQAGIAEFMERGLYARHIHAMQLLYAERHDLLRARIQSKLGGLLDARPATAGTFTVAMLAPGIDDVAVVKALAAAGFESRAFSDSYAKPGGERGLLLGYAVARPEDIRKGVDAPRTRAHRPRFRPSSADAFLAGGARE